MCRTLSVELEELGPLALRARKPMHMSSRCTIFVETEVIHFLQRGVPPEDVAAGVCRALAERVVTLVRRVGLEKPVTMTGGVAKNVAVRRELERRLGARMVKLSIDPQLVGAYGAARLAEARGGAR
jgi:activator of 2-hydroxyglutaryl-CoA dehydratase